MYISLSIRCQDVKMSNSDIYIKLDSGTLIWMHSFFCVLALWHRKVEGFLPLSLSVLALRHSEVFEGVFQCWHSGTQRFAI